jgi:hypothetical protein
MVLALGLIGARGIGGGAYGAAPAIEALRPRLGGTPLVLSRRAFRGFDGLPV